MLRDFWNQWVLKTTSSLHLLCTCFPFLYNQIYFFGCILYNCCSILGLFGPQWPIICFLWSQDILLKKRSNKYNMEEWWVLQRIQYEKKGFPNKRTDTKVKQVTTEIHGREGDREREVRIRESRCLDGVTSCVLERKYHFQDSSYHWRSKRVPSSLDLPVLFLDFSSWGSQLPTPLLPALTFHGGVCPHSLYLDIQRAYVQVGEDWFTALDFLKDEDKDSVCFRMGLDC